MMKSLYTILAAVSMVGVCCPRQHDGPYAFFVVSDPSGNHGDSYILPLSKPDDIAHARGLICNCRGEASRIVVARIERGAGDAIHANRDIMNNDKEWSWHVAEFMGFAEITIEIYDGWPTYVEENLDQWMSETGGVIGFWSYTVTRELDPEEVLVEQN